MGWNNHDDDLAEEHEGADINKSEFKVNASSPAAAWAFATMMIVIAIVVAACCVGGVYILRTT